MNRDPSIGCHQHWLISSPTFWITTLAARGLLAACLLATSHDLASADEPAADIRSWIEQYTAVQRSLDHRFRLPLDEIGETQRREMQDRWLQQLSQCDFDSLDRAAQIDYLLFKSELEYHQAKQQLQRQRDQAAAESIPYSDD